MLIKAKSRAIAYGLSDVALYGHLADAVRTCRQRGDVVYCDPHEPLRLLINGRPMCPKKRAAWHEGKK